MIGKIVKAISGFYYIEYEDYIYECRAKGVLKKNNISPLVGDFVDFEKIDDKFIFFRNEDDLFRFFKHDIVELQEIGEVYYSENFTGIKSIKSGAFKGEIRKGKFDYFELKFTLGNIQDREIINILRAFRNNKKRNTEIKIGWTSSCDADFPGDKDRG